VDKMAKQKIKEIPFLSDDEVERLIKTPPKRPVKKPKKEPEPEPEPEPEIEIIESEPEPEPEPEKPKPIKKSVKKLQDKVLADIKKQEFIRPSVLIPEKTPDIEYVLTTTTKFDLNWYYLKERFIALKRWLLSPYRRYENWFNESFNKPKQVIKINEGIDYEQLKDLFEDLPDSEGNEWMVVKNE
jgi:hypothetical protein